MKLRERVSRSNRWQWAYIVADRVRPCSWQCTYTRLSVVGRQSGSVAHDLRAVVWRHCGGPCVQAVGPWSSWRVVQAVRGSADSAVGPVDQCWLTAACQFCCLAFVEALHTHIKTDIHTNRQTYTSAISCLKLLFPWVH